MNGSVTEWNDFNGRGKVSNDDETNPLSSGDCSARLQARLRGQVIPPDDEVSVTYDVAATGEAINADLAMAAAAAMAVAPTGAAPAAAARPSSAKKKAKKKSVARAGKASRKPAARKSKKAKAKKPTPRKPTKTAGKKRGTQSARKKKRS